MGGAAWSAVSVARADGTGVGPLEGVLLAFFLVLFFWITVNFWAVFIGFFSFLGHRFNRGRGNTVPARRRIPDGLTTAVVMPVYGEDPWRVAAALQAMARSLREAGALHNFDFYLLSDTQNPDAWLAEEAAWYELNKSRDLKGRVFYRRRTRNTEKKAGNIRHFLENWGYRYRYMLVLDADSVMNGETMAELVCRMEENPRLGLLQTRPQVVGGRTFFARSQQFASHVYGRLIAYGLAILQGKQGNYWGHNAIIRVEAFSACCGLPRLPGRPPFGGGIMSHDFVEAALLVRHGWEVRMAPDLTGSYEEAPPNLTLNLVRDRRWFQGNLQHLYVFLSRDIHPVSRICLLTGLMAYVSSPLWFVFVALSIAATLTGHMPFVTGLSLIVRDGYAWTLNVENFGLLIGLLSATVILLFGPKVLGLIVSMAERPLTAPLLVIGSVLETLFSVLLAPIGMVRHSQFLIGNLMGKNAGWNPQTREDTVTWRDGWRAYGGMTIIGLGALYVVKLWGTAAGLWFLPLVAGLVLAVPTVVLSGRPYWRPFGKASALFAVPIPKADRRLLLAACTKRLDPPAYSGSTGRVLEDPAAHALHLYVLEHNQTAPVRSPVPDTLLARIGQDARAELSVEEKRKIFNSPEAVRTLYLNRWVIREGFGPVPESA